MTRRRRVWARAGGLAIMASLMGAWTAQAAGPPKVPRYAVDRNWPRTFPDRWVLGGIGGLCVDAHDHLFILHRQDVAEGDTNAGHIAPPVIEVDAAGRLINAWGDPKLLDQRLHSCAFDKAGNIWIGSAPSGMVVMVSDPFVVCCVCRTWPERPKP